MMPEKFLVVFIIQIILSVICISRKKKILSYVVEAAIPMVVITIELYFKCLELYEIPIYILTYIIAKLITLFIIVILRKKAFKLTVDFTKKGRKSSFYCKIFGKKRFAKFLKTYNNLQYGPRLKLGTPGMVNRMHKETRVRFDKLGFPIFKSLYTVRLKRKYWKCSREAHFYQASRMLYEKAMKDKRFASKFTKGELEKFRKGEVPAKYTWHHHQDAGVLQLVEYKIHFKVSHIGGFSIWGKREKKH